MKILVINGANMNMLGRREPDIYGKEDYAALCARIYEHAQSRGVAVECFQSNHEGALVDAIHQAYFDHVDGIILNPAAYTHTSVALLDATGAGDCFDGNLLARLALGDYLAAAVRYANTAASLTVQGFGAVAPLPTAQQVRAVMPGL